MPLPLNLKNAIEALLTDVHTKDIVEARKVLSERYRNPDSLQKKRLQRMTTHEERFAYLIARFPATFGVIQRIFTELDKRMPASGIQSLLDLGAGPGPVMWAASEFLTSLQSIHLVEQDNDLILLGKKLAAHSNAEVVRSAVWQNGDMTSLNITEPYDLIVLSYSIGELKQEEMKALIERMWQKASIGLIVIEPGTPLAFQRVKEIRSELLRLGGHLLAPCPHEKACPMEGSNWCHFSQRIERSSFHRQVKEGSLGYEDEKFSYLIAVKQAHSTPERRILRHPGKHSGHRTLSLCTKEGLSDVIISKKTPELYKLTRKLEWGDAF